MQYSAKYYKTNEDELRLEQASLLERWKYSITEVHSAFSKQSRLVESPQLGVHRVKIQLSLNPIETLTSCEITVLVGREVSDPGLA